MTGMITRQQGLSRLLLDAVTAPQPSPEYVDLSGMGGTAIVEVWNPDAAGTGTLLVEGSYDDDHTRWYLLGYVQLDNNAGPARVVTPIAVGVTSQHTYQVLDYCRWLRLRPTAAAGFTTSGISAAVYATAV